MRKNSPRKWLHAILDLLPVILIPVFMIYSHRHTIDSYNVQVEEIKVVNVNQLIPNNIMHISFTLEEDKNVNGWGNTIDYLHDMAGHIDHTVLAYCQTTDPLKVKICWGNNTNNFVTGTGGSNNPSVEYGSYVLTNNIVGNLNNSELAWRYIAGATAGTYEADIYLVDLTLWFDGDIPQDLLNNPNTFPNYYNGSLNYNLGSKELWYTGDYITYNDTDIMSQFTYNLYNSVDKYFNMNNVFGLNSVYNWFNLNIFNGNAPLYIYIVWNIVLYEFVMDLLMLLYALFMWFIDICQNLIDRSFNSMKGN